MSGTFTDSAGRVLPNLGAGTAYCGECNGAHLAHEWVIEVSGAAGADGILRSSEARYTRRCPIGRERGPSVGYTVI